ncbi:carbohydrate ABC transporter permease [Paenibacillus sp. HB172176]|uniref:carbohydrate ABC transporter permease n=1 Tax=Paenibacillus sp. HB172176 TaxID=2493690 RepID=UPI00143BC1F4|nr:carbohydrate ABC transporter permease [Paenibacillus sp. HB172176]
MVNDNSLSSRMLDIVVHAAMLLVLLACLIPLLNILAYSFSTPHAISKSGITLIPKEFSLEGYKAIFKDSLIPRSFLNSILITGGGTLINIALTILTAYPLSKSKLPFRKYYLFLIVATMFFGGGLIPGFILVNALGLYNSYLALILPTALSVWNLLIMMSFFRSFPQELEESAKLDGAGELSILFRIVIPLSMAPIMTIALFYAVGHWNSYFQALIYLRDTDKFPLQLILREIVLDQQMAADLAARSGTDQRPVSSEGVKYSTLIISIVPMLLVYPYIQNYFVKGVMIGSLKG